MVTIKVAKPFTLSPDEGEPQVFGVGSYEVEQEVADHWYVKAHLAPPDPVAETGSKGKKGKAPAATDPQDPPADPPPVDPAAEAGGTENPQG